MLPVVCWECYPVRPKCRTITWIVRWVASASSVFSGADAQIGGADCLFIRPPMAALAEEQSLPEVTLNVRSWPIVRIGHTDRKWPHKALDVNGCPAP